MQLYPALDIRGARVARAGAGDPLKILHGWRVAGVTWVHVVDMDRAEGTGDNTAVVRALLHARQATRVQLGGALTDGAVTAALGDGADRVVVGSAGIGTLADLLARHGPERVGCALDVRAGSAWSPDGTIAGDPVALFDHAVDAGVRTVILRDLSRDGTLSGAALDLLAPFCRDGVDLVIAGGVQSLADLAAARDAGAAGAIVGRALLEGRIGIEEALACCG